MPIQNLFLVVHQDCCLRLPFKASSKKRADFLCNVNQLWNSSSRWIFHGALWLGLSMVLLGFWISLIERSLSQIFSSYSSVITLWPFNPLTQIASNRRPQGFTASVLGVVFFCWKMALLLANHISQQINLGVAIQALLTIGLFRNVQLYFFVPSD